MLHKPGANNCAIMPNTGTAEPDMVVRVASGNRLSESRRTAAFAESGLFRENVWRSL